MFFLIAVGLLSAILTGFMVSAYGFVLILASVPIGASLGVIAAGLIVAWQTKRRFKDAADPRYVGLTLGVGLREVFADSLKEPMPERIRALVGKLSGSRNNPPAA